jgi:hypothetical protein
MSLKTPFQCRLEWDRHGTNKDMGSDLSHHHPITSPRLSSPLSFGLVSKKEKKKGRGKAGRNQFFSSGSVLP